MKEFKECLKVPMEPKAHEEAFVYGKDVRFTVITSRLIRMEYSKNNKFRDEATKTFWFRKQEVPKFTYENNDDKLVIETEHLRLDYTPNILGFTHNSLKILVKDNGFLWNYGMDSWPNLRGTLRTLDDVDGETHIGPGLMSREGWATVDDSDSFTFDRDGWFVEELREAGSYEDIYFFGYGTKYKECLKDFIKLSGKVPMLPRWVLGNWWSRYWEYNDEELLGLMNKFKDEKIPLSVCIVDMDWHITDVPREKNGGWTGYTWNKELFKEPKSFIRELHDLGLKTALNLHPADGVRPHEEMYSEMAKFMGVNEEKGDTVFFDITNKKFAQGYLKYLHHPHEKDGVDFWWMDWQQGKKTKWSHLDPLFILNHLHFADAAKEESKRPFIFSRWGGLGNHRYPIGFSGDTVISWESLSFQPYVTSTAANVGYGWWSHDIGGHMNGIADGELYTRWVQYGVFSPIMRLHSTKQTFADRHPWGYTKEVLDITAYVMRLRHRLIPYIYTLSWKNHEEDIPPFLPLYYEYPNEDEAYKWKDEYYFGEGVIAAPFVNPKDDVTQLTRKVIWLPEGEWYDFFSGEYYEGNRHYALYGKLDEIPIFAKSGTIIPLGEEVDWDGVDNPSTIELNIYPGDKGEFELFEDDGVSQGYKNNKYALTRITQEKKDDYISIKIFKSKGESEYIPEDRGYVLNIKAFNKPSEIVVIKGDIQEEVQYKYNDNSIITDKIEVRPNEEVEIIIKEYNSILKNRNQIEKVEKLIKACKLRSDKKEWLWQRREEIIKDISILREIDLHNSIVVALCEIINDKPVFNMQ
ncbi:glycoside hydrolase family 31 protein [Oceanirhabdus sp. W0125-5]|uniref:glycoside hydrolase family 31 protein n=1 Tax=Oceanirhabdus sp. W0125-5 TaxID=2999116 RepID=UPI0022F2D683|nr:glycoside hydrolase family 31 protein [Oceanirhabdus sp. W0125-5]WBW97861.1 glycoside hydrolase family 31 protein [Oceanirhabdus sp. W0125-5]